MLSQPSHKIVLGSRFEVEVDLGDHPKLHLLAGRGCNAQAYLMYLTGLRHRQRILKFR